MSMNIRILEATYSDILSLDSINSLLASLSPDAPAITDDVLRELIEGPVTRLLLATIDSPTAKGTANEDTPTVTSSGEVLENEDSMPQIVGMLTLAIFRIPSGIRAWIEDVVVDTEMRGNGIGAALVRQAIEIAQRSGARTIDLTSRPGREAANRLYQRLGFKQRSTNVYRYTIDN